MDSDQPPFWWDIYQQRLRCDLAGLPREHQLAFAGWCCERLYPVYEILCRLADSDSAATLRRLLDRLWQQVLGQQMTSQELETALRECEQLTFGAEGAIPHEQYTAFIQQVGMPEPVCVDYSQLQATATDAVGAVWLALEACRCDTAANVARVAGCALERIRSPLWDERVASLRVVDPQTGWRIEEEISRDPLVTAEIQKQRDQLDYLRTARALTPDDVSRFH